MISKKIFLKEKGVKMTSLNMAEKAMIFNYILLTSQVTLDLEDVLAGNHLSDQQCELLKEGSTLLERIIEGAILVEGKKSKNGLTPTMEGLSIYGFALSTIRELNLIREIKEKEFTDFFEKMHSEMLKLIEQRKKDGINVPLLKSFFFALGSSLRGDIQKESYPKGKSLPTNKEKLMNEYSCA
jgi:hypothetical protein